MNWIDKDLIPGKVLVKEADWNAMSLRVSELAQHNIDLMKRNHELKKALKCVFLAWSRGPGGYIPLLDVDAIEKLLDSGMETSAQREVGK